MTEYSSMEEGMEHGAWKPKGKGKKSELDSGWIFLANRYDLPDCLLVGTTWIRVFAYLVVRSVAPVDGGWWLVGCGGVACGGMFENDV
jgi:hypothetical protein